MSLLTLNSHNDLHFLAASRIASRSFSPSSDSESEENEIYSSTRFPASHLLRALVRLVQLSSGERSGDVGNAHGRLRLVQIRWFVSDARLVEGQRGFGGQKGGFVGEGGSFIVHHGMCRIGEGWNSEERDFRFCDEGAHGGDQGKDAGRFQEKGDVGVNVVVVVVEAVFEFIDYVVQSQGSEFYTSHTLPKETGRRKRVYE